jgi:hypothetical protein
VTGLQISLLAVQVLTFVGLGVTYLALGQWRLGVAQILLAAVQAVIYTGSMS